MMQPEKTPEGSGYKSPWVWTILGLFAVMFTVNYMFFTVGKSTAPGLVNEEYYKYGLQQNKVDRQYRKQAARGWSVTLSLPETWQAGETTTLALHVTDKAGAPLTGGIAEITSYRPSDSKLDIVQQLKEKEQTGIYQSDLILPVQGAWDLNVLFTLGEDKHMLNQRINVQGDGNAEPSTLEKIVNFINP